MKKILIIEDDVYLREELVHTFKQKGYVVSSISSFATVKQDTLSYGPDLLILDITLPGTTGFEICKWLKARSSFPILILTARDTLTDELSALGIGADDYLSKPCHPERLLARAERLLQHYEKMRNVIQIKDVILDKETYQLVYRDKSVFLPETEGKILTTLFDHYPSTVSKEELTRIVWENENYISENILSVNLTRLRKTLKTINLESLIQTKREIGYCIKVADDTKFGTTSKG